MSQRLFSAECAAVLISPLGVYRSLSKIVFINRVCSAVRALETLVGIEESSIQNDQAFFDAAPDNRSGDMKTLVCREEDKRCAM